MDNDHPIAWMHEFHGGRSWYTGGGHTEASYAEPDFLKHILGGAQMVYGPPLLGGRLLLYIYIYYYILV